MIAEIDDPEDFSIVAINTTTPDSFSAPLRKRLVRKHAPEKRTADDILAETFNL